MTRIAKFGHVWMRVKDKTFHSSKIEITDPAQLAEYKEVRKSEADKIAKKEPTKQEERPLVVEGKKDESLPAGLGRKGGKSTWQESER